MDKPEPFFKAACDLSRGAGRRAAETMEVGGGKWKVERSNQTFHFPLSTFDFPPPTIFRRSLHVALRRPETIKARHVVTNKFVTTWLFSEDHYANTLARLALRISHADA